MAFKNCSLVQFLTLPKSLMGHLGSALNSTCKTLFFSWVYPIRLQLYGIPIVSWNMILRSEEHLGNGLVNYTPKLT